MVVYYNSVLPCNARRRVTSSIYSRSPPTGTPLAIRVTLIPVGLMSLLIYIAVVSPSRLEFVAIITSSTSFPDAPSVPSAGYRSDRFQAWGKLHHATHGRPRCIFRFFIGNQIAGIFYHHNRLVISGCVTADRTNFLICQVITALAVFDIFFAETIADASAST